MSTGEILNQTSKVTPPNVWLPNLTFNLTKLFQLTWNDKFVQKHHFYVCPGYLKGKSNSKQCGGERNYFCASWSCVSTGNIWWTPPVTTNLINVSRPPGSQNIPCNQSHPLDKTVKSNCNPVTIKFTEKGKTGARWISGLSWGVHLYDSVRLGSRDQGALFTIGLTQQPAPTQAIGPNKVLKLPYVRPPPQPRTTPVPSRPHKSASIATPGPPGTGSSLRRPGPTTRSTDPLWNLVNAAFLTLNHTSPNMTTSCWLCYEAPIL
jgi:hypothetical protein